MSRPWWDADPAERRPPELVPDRDLSPDRRGRAAPWRRPRVHADDARAIAAETLARRARFTPSWTGEREDDAGLALVDLVAHQVAAVARCADQLTLKARVELLRAAGIGPLPPRPLRALLSFQVSPSAPRPVAIAAGFEVSATDDGGRTVPFETEATIVACPGKLAAIASEVEGVIEEAEVPQLADRDAVLAFGPRPAPGAAVYLGIDGAIAPAPSVALAWFAAAPAGAPPAASAGGNAAPAGVAPLPVLTWEVLDGPDVVPAQLLQDQTSSLTRTGIVELRVPPRWRPTTLPRGRATPLRWLRARVLQGRYPASPPSAVHVALNAVWASSGETVRSEVLEPVAAPGERARVFRLARAPVLVAPSRPGAPQSAVDLVVDEGDAEPRAWREEPDLAAWRPDARVYRLDPVAGTVEFGDGERGLRVPDGFRHVQARSYRVHAPAGRVAAGAITGLVGSAPFVTAVTNPAAASGAASAEDLAGSLRRGPREIRARGRAVAAVDYEVCALRAPGADVRRVRAEPGYHPEAPGRPVPGVVGLLVVPEDRGDGDPPVPDEQTLRAVVEHLAREAAPAGVDVIAAAPRYVRVSVDLSFVPRRGVDLGAAVSDVIQRLDRYLHPLTGGDDGQGWAFGGAIRQVALLRALLDGDSMVRAVPRLSLIVDGVRFAECGERPIERLALLWPGAHQVIPIGEEEVS